MTSGNISATDSKINSLKKFIKKAASEIDAKLSIRLWNGEILPLGENATQDVFITINSPEAIRRFIWSPNLTTVAEIYAERLVDIEGCSLLEAVNYWDHLKVLAFAKSISKIEIVKAFAPFAMMSKKAAEDSASGYNGQVASKYKGGRQDQEFISHHYDLSNDFYKLFLDEEMVYSCAYFDTTETSLEDAQIAKLDYICKKLQLKEGDKLLDIGCGWGGFSCHAASNYGVQVHGVTLSQEQLEFAKAKVKRLGIEDKVTLELKDYRLIPTEQQYDKVSQIEMFEHVGLDNHELHFQHVHGLLKPDGIYFHQASTRRAIFNMQNFRKQTKYMDFITKHIFPGGEMDHIGLTVTNLERLQFEVHDVEGLREHFSITLRHWVNRLLEKINEATDLVGDYKTRIWLFYLSMCCIAFHRGGIGLFQVVASKRQDHPTNRPMTRKSWYH